MNSQTTERNPCPECGSYDYREETREDYDGFYSVVDFTCTEEHSKFTEKICLACGHRYDKVITETWTERVVC
jgi:predicted nucleic-acid-binding Zn-ribbon protein